ERCRCPARCSLSRASVYCSASNRKNNIKKRTDSSVLTTLNLTLIFRNRSAVKKRSGTYKMLQATTTVFVVAACLQFVVIELFKAKRDTTSLLDNVLCYLTDC